MRFMASEIAVNLDAKIQPKPHRAFGFLTTRRVIVEPCCERNFQRFPILCAGIFQAELLGTGRDIGSETGLKMRFEQAGFLRPFEPPKNVAAAVVDDNDFQLLWPRIHVQAIGVVQPGRISRDQDRLRIGFCNASPTAVLKHPSMPATPRLACNVLPCQSNHCAYLADVELAK